MLGIAIAPLHRSGCVLLREHSLPCSRLEHVPGMNDLMQRSRVYLWAASKLWQCIFLWWQGHCAFPGSLPVVSKYVCRNELAAQRNTSCIVLSTRRSRHCVWNEVISGGLPADSYDQPETKCSGAGPGPVMAKWLHLCVQQQPLGIAAICVSTRALGPFCLHR